MRMHELLISKFNINITDFQLSTKVLFIGLHRLPISTTLVVISFFHMIVVVQIIFFTVQLSGTIIPVHESRLKLFVHYFVTVDNRDVIQLSKWFH